MPIAARIVGVYHVDAHDPCFLVEISVTGGNDWFDVGLITQPVQGQPRENWPVPYDERLLDAAGEQLVRDKDEWADRERKSKPGAVRIAFFFHHLNFDIPLQTPFGNLFVPRATPRPMRLDFIEYFAV